MRAIIMRLVTGLITSRGWRDFRRFLYAVTRKGPQKVYYFHQVDDPYSYLTAQVLGILQRRYPIELIPVLVGPPPDAAAPEREKLRAYARRDAKVLAEAYGLNPPANIVDAPPGEMINRATEISAASLASGTFVNFAAKIGAALWQRDNAALERLGEEGGSATVEDAARALREGNALREKLGHYLGAVFYFEGEFYWGVDRLHYLEHRLGGTDPIMPAREAVLGPVPKFAAPPVIDFWFSIRSPYSWLSFPRVVRLAHHYGAKLNLMFVLPMVMRGLPVPGAKRRYIMYDNVREADRVGLPYGPIVDPVGAGAERTLAVLCRAIPMGLGEKFCFAALEACWSRGVDLASDKGLNGVAGACGIGPDIVARALADPQWRNAAEAHRLALFEAGLWGVPSFRVNGKPAHWGQDRIRFLEQDILNEAIK